MLCPVDEAGTLTEEAGPFAGLNVLKDANPAIITALRDAGLLLAEQRYEHRYPYDWRTKKPTIFRATEQWFASVDGFRAQALDAIAAVEWLPASGRNRIEAMVRERGDWCISRQRSWGVPIPVFYHRETGEVLLNADTLAHARELIAEHGADVWWERDEAGLLPPAWAGQAEQWRKGTDTMDVWFDSGSSWAGVLEGRGLGCPADLYLEGSDQHRGWFQSSLLTSVAVNGHAPYRRVLTHGFTLDEKGRKMSKSLGNVVDPAVLVEGGRNEKQDPPYGADVLRLWVSSVDYSADVPLGPGIVKQLADVYRKVRNTARYLLGNLHDFVPSEHAVAIVDLPLLDRWMLQRTARLIEEVSADFERFEFYRFFQALQNFCVVDLSNVYLDIAKDRLYVSAAADFRRRSCQTVLHLVVERLAGLIAPVLCHMAEDIWQNLPYPVAEASVFERGWPDGAGGLACERRLRVTFETHSGIRDLLLVLRPMVNRQLETLPQASGPACVPPRRGADRLLPGGPGATGDRRLRCHHSPAGRPGRGGCQSSPRRGQPGRLAAGVGPARRRSASGSGPLAEMEEGGVRVRIARAEGSKCERCWHHETDIGQHAGHPSLCGRCVAVLEG